MKKTSSMPGEMIDVRVHEVSLVDRAANKRRFLLVKRDGAALGGGTTSKEPRVEWPRDLAPPHRRT